MPSYVRHAVILSQYLDFNDNGTVDHGGGDDYVCDDGRHPHDVDHDHRGDEERMYW